MALCYTYRPSQSHASAGSHAAQAARVANQQQRQVTALRTEQARPVLANLSCVDLLTAF